jgi:hypothetical protein
VSLVEDDSSHVGPAHQREGEAWLTGGASGERRREVDGGSELIFYFPIDFSSSKKSITLKFKEK